MLRRIREARDKEKFLKDQSEIDSLGEYNAFSRPRPSQAMPLRTTFLDTDVNNFPPSKTRTELLKRIRFKCVPHPSYDVVIFLSFRFTLFFKILKLKKSIYKYLL